MFWGRISASHISLCLSISALKSPLSAACQPHLEHSSVIRPRFALKRPNLTPADSLCCLPCYRDTGDCWANMTLHTGRQYGGRLGPLITSRSAPLSSPKPNRVSDSQAHIQAICGPGDDLGRRPGNWFRLELTSWREREVVDEERPPKLACK